MSPITELIGGAKAYGWGSFAAVGDFESIATVSVGGGGAASVTFSSIPAIYSHLQIRAIGRGTSENSISTNITLNSDTGANYSWHELYGDGASAVAGAAANESLMGGFFMAGGNRSASIFGVGILDILDYKDTNKYTTVRHLSGYDSNGAGFAMMRSGSWRNTAAVTSITFTPANNFVQYSSFALYGIRSA